MITFSEMDAIKTDFSPIETLEAGTYIHGHPQINEPDSIYLAITDDRFLLLRKGHPESVHKTLLGEIPRKNIKQILLEDKTTVEKRVTAARLLTVGIFAFAWKKKEAHEMAFVVIEWVDAKNMEHKTTFKLEGGASLVTANTLRNALLKYL